MEKLTPNEWRRARNKTIEDCARAIGVAPATWSKWEKRPSLIPIGKAEEFCSFIGMPAEAVSFLP